MVEIHIGTAGWSYADWKGIVYPRRRPGGFHELDHLASYIDCVEINSSFYRPPEPRLARRWAEIARSHPDLVLTVKLWQRFTHDPPGAWGKEDVSTFLEGIAPLRESLRLGAILVQFPWFFRDSPESRERIRRIAGAFGGYPLVVEVRHRSWIGDAPLDFLRGKGLSFCNIDQPFTRETIPPTAIVTGPLGYVRLHGRNAAAWFDRKAHRDEKYNYLYSEEELGEWLDRVDRLRAETGRVFVIANNHFGGKAFANALEMRARLTGRKVRAPEEILRAFPHLREHVQTPPDQPDLF